MTFCAAYLKSAQAPSSLSEILSSLKKPNRRGPSSPRRSFAERRMSCNVNGSQLYVTFQWIFPSSSDKSALRSVREKAVAFARETEPCQVNAVKKALTDNGYHLIK